jgi:hypothetical protein
VLAVTGLMVCVVVGYAISNGVRAFDAGRYGIVTTLMRPVGLVENVEVSCGRVDHDKSLSSKKAFDLVRGQPMNAVAIGGAYLHLGWGLIGENYSRVSQCRLGTSRNALGVIEVKSFMVEHDFNDKLNFDFSSHGLPGIHDPYRNRKRFSYFWIWGDSWLHHYPSALIDFHGLSSRVGAVSRSVGRFFGGPPDQKREEGVTNQSDYRSYLNFVAFLVAGFLFFAGGVVLLAKVWRKISFDRSPYMNAAAYLALLFTGAALIWLGMRLVFFQFGFLSSLRVRQGTGGVVRARWFCCIRI